MLNSCSLRNIVKIALPGMFACMFSHKVCGQQLKPGLEGMSPSKWITIKHSQAPGRSYRTLNTQKKAYTHEDFFFKAWLPVVNGSRFALAIAPQYRTEQLEMEDEGENAIHTLANWNLRSAGIDLKSLLALDSSSWLVFGGNVNKSGNFGAYSFKDFPLNYTLSSAFVKKPSNNKEWGFGLIFNKNYDRLTILPIFIFHYNFSKKSGIEISLPYKAAWRFNATRSDIFYVKAEASNRSYFIKQDGADGCFFRRTDIDMGLAYNKQLTKLIGFELFAGYKQNIANVIPPEVVAVKKSGPAFSLEVYLRPPFKGKSK